MADVTHTSALENHTCLNRPAGACMQNTIWM